MSILKLLASSSFLTVNKELAKKLGLEVAVFYADLASAQIYYNDKGETWFYRTRDQIENETTLSHKKQVECLKLLKKHGLIKSVLKGLPAVTHYLIDEECVQNLSIMLGINSAFSCAKMEELVKPKRRINNNIKNNNKEYINNSSEEIETDIFPFNFSLNLIQAINKFFVYRKEIKKPLKNISKLNKIKEFESQVADFGERAVIESIENAIANGYQGTFIKTNKTNQNGINNAKQELTDFIRNTAFGIDCDKLGY
jgi:hypothetical protein